MTILADHTSILTNTEYDFLYFLGKLSLFQTFIKRTGLKSTRLVYRLVETYSELKRITDSRNSNDDVRFL